MKVIESESIDSISDSYGKFSKMRFIGSISVRAIASFIMVLVLSYTLIGATIINRSNLERLAMESLINKKSTQITDVISKLLYKTHMLNAIIIQGDGRVDNFERVAAIIVDDPSILNVLIAPDGVISDVYPLKGNEAVIGLDYFSESAGNKEAVLAYETGELVFGGPFNLLQGGQALVGRMPVYLGNDENNKRFWGLVSVTLKYPQALNGAVLEDIDKEGLSYEIWRINPDDGSRQTIAIGSNGYNNKMRYVESKMAILNAEWYFRIAPVKNWYGYLENWLMLLVGLGISLLVAYVAQSNHTLSIMKDKMEKMAHIDMLTNISNRRHFIEQAALLLERASRLKSEKSDCFVVIFDIDKFKDFNDKFGHQFGDEVLRQVALRIKNAVRPYDLFARYGGEEFIILATDITEAEIMRISERLRRIIADNPVSIDGVSNTITASFGIDGAAPDYNLDHTIINADMALYAAKAQGRNCVVRYRPNLK